MRASGSAVWHGCMKDAKGAISTKSGAMDGHPYGFAITAVHLTLAGRVPSIDQALFEQLASAAKAGCPVSKLLRAPVTLDVTLRS